MSASAIIPDNIFNPTNISMPENVAPLSDELITEVKGQLIRKLTEKFGGKLNLADAVALYANSVEGAKRVMKARTNKDGSDNKSGKNFGNIFEEMEVTALNREAIVKNTGAKAARTNAVGDQKKQGNLEHESLEPYAKVNHQHTDIVVYGANGQILETYQAKQVEDIINVATNENYTTHENAPDKIVVPKDKYGKAKDEIKNKKTKTKAEIEKTNDPEEKKKLETKLEQLEIADKKLVAGKTASWCSGHPDKKSHPILTELVEKTGGDTGAVAKALPYVAIAAQSGKDAAARAGSRIGTGLLSEAGALVIGGAIWELRDAWRAPDAISIYDRIKRFVFNVLQKIKESSIVRCGKEITLEVIQIILGVLGSLCGSLKAFLKLLGKSLSQVWDSIYNYVTGKIASFSALISIIVKTVAAVGIGSLAVALEAKLSMLGIPHIIGGLLAAALAGIAIVFVNRGIDAFIFSVTSAFSNAKAAAIRRERIEEYCEEMLPRLMEEREKFKSIVDSYYTERQKVINESFIAIKSHKIMQDNVKLFASLENLNQLFGKSLGWKTQDEFDAMMISDEAFCL